ncbi:MAG: hypothetical protein GF405_08040, partial [Candidatus Eisenbacteria bacterium]|nr:hypothetical protein [Candidatus Eisenbacteria bacterium]
AYPLLERLVARDLLEMDLATRPVTRRDVAAALSDVTTEVVGRRASARERWALERLRAEFMSGTVDGPAVGLERGEGTLGLGVTLGVQAVYGEEREGVTLWPGTVPAALRDGLGGPVARCSPGDSEGELDPAVVTAYELWGGVGEHLGFEAESRIVFREQDGPRQVRLSSRARTWRGVAALAERAYVLWESEHLTLAAGRRGPAWGRSRWGRLLVSGTAPTFDQADARLDIGPLSFHALHAVVERAVDGPVDEGLAMEDVYLGAHRVALAGDAGSIAVSELVVYSSTVPDPVYVNPFVPYYLMQHNERGNDNILWGLDYDWRPAPGLEVYGEFVVDDLQYDRDTGNPDKYGASIGAAHYGGFRGMDTELVVEYTNVRKWTYTHMVTEHRLEHDGVPVGFELGPDADRAVLEARLHPCPSWTTALVYRRARRGEGRLDEPFEEGQDDDPAFPSGVVETSDRIALEFAYDALEGLAVGGGAAYVRVENAGNVEGENEDDWELWAGIRLRIGRGGR